MPDSQKRGFLLLFSILALIAGLIFLRLVQKHHDRDDQFSRNVQSRLNSELSSIDSRKANLRNRLAHSEEPEFSRFEDRKGYPVFVFLNQRLYYWSDYHYAPRYREIEGAYTYKYLLNSKGSFVVVKGDIGIGNQNAEVFYTIPLHLDTRITNQFLRPEFNRRLFHNASHSVHPPEAEIGHIITDPDGMPLFRVEFHAGYGRNIPVFSALALTLSLLILLLSPLFLWQSTALIIHRRGYGAGLFFLLFAIPALRALMLVIEFPSSYTDAGLFAPRNYASSAINPSLGDLMLNLLGIGGVAFYFFSFYMKMNVFRALLRTSPVSKATIGVLLVFLPLGWLAVHHQLVYSLSFHSRWSMDISGSLDFGGLRLLSYGLYFFSGIIFFLIAHPVYRILARIFGETPAVLIPVLFTGGFIFIGISLMVDWSYGIVLLVCIPFVAVLMWSGLPSYLARVQYLTFVYFFFFGLPPAIAGAHAGYIYYMDQSKSEKDRLASQLLLERDLFTEYLLIEAAGKIQSDVFIQNRIFSPYASKDIIEQKIRRVYLSNYLDQYEIQIYVFNSRGDLFSEGRRGFNYFALREEFKAYQTEHEGLYYISQLDRSAVSRYLCFVELKRYSQVAGYVLISLRLKRFFQNALFPMLLADSRYAVSQQSMPRLSYAIFDGHVLLSNFGDFNYRTDVTAPILDNPRLFGQGVVSDGYQHVGFKSAAGKIIVIGSRIYPLRSILANISFYFLIYVISILCLIVVLAVYSWIRRSPQNYATRIQLYLNFAFFLPMVVISITVLSIIVRAYQQDMETRNMQRALNLSTRLSSTLSDYLNEIGDRELLSNEIYDIAQYAELDINLFNRSGRLLASSQPLIYDNEILSSYINPVAFTKLVEQQGNSIALDESIGSLRFKNAYVSINSFDDGSLLGILSLPYFTSSLDLEKNISSVLSTMLIIFALVFMVFLIISYLASDTLTFPLRLITQKIRRTTLSGYNEPLSWNSDDEIGLMVKEYNAMLVNLEQSKTALARSEKENAWREMARQVAHEIKNPLTPMKLTLQYMRRRISAGDEDNSESRRNQIDLLLEQINTLSEIASSFSEFAKMPPPRWERIDLTSILREIAELYGKQELGRITTEIPDAQLQIEGDRQWISRAISNIVINGFQSAGTKAEAHLVIRCRPTGYGFVHIEVEDNGEGIAAEIQEKVFLPNFSTKSSGSGLGLAIAKRGIEHAGGRVWFETHPGQGTVFHIDFPLV